MDKELVKNLRLIADHATDDCDGAAYGCVSAMYEAADAIEELITRVDYLEDCIYRALDALDRGNDNDWAREALEAADKPSKEET